MRTQNNPYLSRTARNEHQERVLEGVALWAGYYRHNIHRFAMDFLHIHLHLFQIFVLVMMDIASTFVFIGFRGIGKSFLCAVFCCCRAILYPGTRIVIASGTRGQSVNVLEKIMMEIKPNSPELANEIDEKASTLTNTEAKIVFKNTSTIKVVTAGDSARSNRAHILIVDEFRMVKKNIIDTILRKFLAGPRHPKFMDKPQYKGHKEYKERNKTLYFSSAYYKDHWSFTRCKDSFRFMLDETKSNFICGFPYQLGLVEDILTEEEVEEQMLESDFNEISWDMEMSAIFIGDTNGSFFGLEDVSKNRKIEYPWMPDYMTSSLKNDSCLRIPPKQAGEIRLLSADIALMASTRHKNDATAIFINSMIPSKSGRYVSNIMYTEVNEGYTTEDEALKLRKMFEEYACDYLVIDGRNVGLSIYDLLARDITDPDTGEVYPAMSCYNNQDFAARCKVTGAQKTIWVITGSAKFNSDSAVALREGFRSGRIKLLVNEYDAEDLLGQIPGWGSLNPSTRAALTLPYVNTTMLINELINLKHEDSTAGVRLYEKSTARKDRFSSLCYNYWVATQLEMTQRHNTFDPVGEQNFFRIRKPKIKHDERW